jgi:hypothetical protein
MTTITDSQMTSESGRHHATPVRDGDPYGMWEVSWLPGRELTRNQAITAMILADYVDRQPQPPEPGCPRWTFVEGWADELRLTGRTAVDKIRGASR